MTPADRKSLAADYEARETAGGGIGNCDPAAIIREIAKERDMTPKEVAEALKDEWASIGI